MSGDETRARRFQVGKEVLGLRKNGRWYPATVATQNRDGTYGITWDSGDRKETRQPHGNLSELRLPGEFAGRRPKNQSESSAEETCGPRDGALPVGHGRLLASADPQVHLMDTPAAQALLYSLGCKLSVADVLSLPRYVRLTRAPGSTVNKGMTALTKEGLSLELREFGLLPSECSIRDTPLEDFVALPYSLSIAHLPSHRGGQLVGQDLSSGVAVRALVAGRLLHGDSRRPCHALELCCAPGGKLLYLAEILLQHRRQADISSAHEGLSPTFCTVTGVDSDPQRLNQCRGAVRRLSLPNVRLFEADGRTFSVPPPATVDEFPSLQTGDVHFSCLPPRKQGKTLKRRLLKQRNMAASTSILAAQTTVPQRTSGSGPLSLHPPPATESEFGYDLVLLDAECSADASIPHLRHMLACAAAGERLSPAGAGAADRQAVSASGASKAAGRASAAECRYSSLGPAGDCHEELLALQSALLENAFRLLAPGGDLIYATCSSHAAQNEDLVEAFLRREPSAVLRRVDTCGVPAQRTGRDGFMACMGPAISQTSGLFLSKISKSA